MKQIVILSACLVFLTGVWWFSTPTPGSFLDPNVQNSIPKRPAKDFKLQDLNGKEVSLAQYRGKVVLLNFWATWCGPCVKEIPDLIRLQEKYKAEGVQVIGVSVDVNGFDDVRPFLAQKQLNLNYPVIVANHLLLEGYKNPSVLPTTFLIDQNGMILNEMVGIVTEQRLKPWFDQLL